MKSLTIEIDVGKDGKGYSISVRDSKTREKVAKDYPYSIATLREAYEYVSYLRQTLEQQGAIVDGDYVSRRAMYANAFVDNDAKRLINLYQRGEIREVRV